MHTDCHVLLVSDQPTPNITPVLDAEFRPAAVVLVESPDKARQAQWIADALQDTGIRIERWPIDDAWNIEHIRDRMLDLLAQREHEAVALNVTGGTKPMAIAAYEVFRAHDKPIFYVHPETDHLIWMYHPENPPPRDLADRIKLPRFLLAHGARVTRTGSRFGVPESLRKLTGDLILNIEPYAPVLSTLNWAAGTAERSLVSEPIPERIDARPHLRALIRNFEQAGLLKEQDGRLIFADDASRFYANGGWLEEYVYGLCVNLKADAGIQDIGRDLEVERPTPRGVVPNQIDVAFLANNRLYVIECKTGRLESQPHGEGKGADALYKLDSLTDLLGGLKAKALLVSYQNLKSHDLQRASVLQIEVCCGQRLKELPTRLRQWIQSN